MSDTLIKVEGLYKKFCRSLKRSMYYGTTDMTRDMFGFPRTANKLRKSEFWALQDINFELKRGETLGLIGQNGCGKTTLLRLLNGIFPPDKGKIFINGRIGALISVGAGFHPQMTGRENIFLNGTILGMSKSEIKRKFDAIVDFSEIGEFLDSPVSTYSSGMYVRLGFAIAIHCEPEILLIDEILAVGDISFQAKCFNKLKFLKDNGVAIILISHAPQQVYDNCNRGILLNYGKMICDTTIGEAVKRYEQLICTEKVERATLKKTEKIVETNFYITNSNGRIIDNEFDPDDELNICLEIFSKLDLNNCFITFHIHSMEGFCITHIRNDKDGIDKIQIQKDKTKFIKITIKNLHLEGGGYQISYVIFNAEDKKPVADSGIIQFTIKGNKKTIGFLKLDHEWSITK